ncbi:hypothetical protein A9Q84_08950 [Halobacteriovorax marinus]|uniref:D-alanyl-D-alanine carboxypeptidase/D-alanyl-D-alanine-endopeptidase n=1 Tax=Halobacteriovorax marinus TaxID=97084 RepID=A0A1Y5F6F3_9BACT|nr:hypothetical protein A9Q84_08950 [Halobacteriovorax marinus]
MIQFLKVSLTLLFTLNSFANNKLPFKTSKEEFVAWSFKKLDEEKTFAKNQFTLHIPASVLKIFSMTYALEKLGPDFIFKTKVYYSGVIKNNILEGNLYIVGGSDPYLNHSQIFNMALAVKTLGIKKINGSLIYDVSSYPEHQKISELGLGDQTYNPSFGPLNSEFNRHSLWKKRKDFVSIIEDLPISIEQAHNDFFPTQKFKWRKIKNKESWWINKSATFSKRQDIPIRNAGLWTTKLFRYHLKSLNINIEKIQKSTTPKNVHIIFENRSLPLWKLISMTMEYSNNLLAEAITIKACEADGVRPLNQKQCAKKVASFIKKQSKATSKIQIINASGLSSKNFITTDLMASYLKNSFYKTWKGHSLQSFLSISGQSGWIRNRLNDPGYNMHVMAKTGSLDFINNIAGYIRTKKNEWYSFSVNHSNTEKRKALDESSKGNFKELINEARGWRKKSLKKVDRLLRTFIDTN